ncbi:MAG: LysE family translocator [Burkholderiales bacterium]|nr:LysE family translocator [Burkholderiales bacterium]
MNLAVHDLPLFLTAALLVNLTPGPDMLFVAGSSAVHGRRAGVLAALGVGAGCLLHVALAAVGLSALLAASATAFAVVKWVGAAYLVWVGVSMLRARARVDVPTADQPPGVPPAQGSSRVFWQGAWTNALNPKVALFFLAFLPQFIVPGAPQQALSFLALGLVFTVGGVAVNIVVALLTHRVRRGLAGRSGSARFGVWLQRAAGALFVGLGLKLAFSSR